MSKFLEKTPLYPFLIAVYPVLYLLSINIGELDSPLAGLRAGLIFLAIALLAFLFFLACTHNARLSGFYALVIVLFFFLVFFLAYAPIYRALRTVMFQGEPLGRHRYLVPAFLLLTFLLAIVLLRLKSRISNKALKNISLSANIIALLLVVIPIGVMLATTLRNQASASKSAQSLPPVTPLNTSEVSALPDIYYIILDMHTSDNALSRLMDYDNSAFTDALEERGFYVARCSQSNYENTRQSLTSSLNLDYVQDLGLGGGTNNYYPAFQESRVRRMLEGAGYTTYAFQTGYWFVEIKDADHYSAPTSGALNLLTYPGVTTFESLILSDSAGQLLYENRASLSKRMQTIIDAPYMERRTDILNVLDTLPAIASESGPKFVYAHVLAPHDPFVFDENGDPAFRRTPFTDVNDPEFGTGFGWESYKGPYVKEVMYLDQRVLETIDQILANSATPPIIIIQGDHGIPYSSRFNAQFQILNAYYFPKVDDPGLYDTISPVNSFRLLFNNYFGTDYPLLPDQSYLTEETLTLFTEEFPCP